MEERNRKKLIIGIVAILVVAIIGVALFIYLDQARQKGYSVEEITGGDGSDEIEYQGKRYRLNANVTSILVIGVDTAGELKCNRRYGEAGQADSITMVILNSEKKTIQVLPLSRDTLTAVHHYSAQGYDQGTMVTHLGYAYSFGDGATESCINTCLAVTDLLKGARVNHYGAASVDSLTKINDAFGGVTVTVPNNDIAHRHPECTAGATVTLNSENVQDFLRYRDTSVNFSNNGRMARNRAFFDGVIKKIQSMNQSEIEAVWQKIKKGDGRFLCSLSQKQYLQVASQLRDYTYDAATCNLSLAGEDGIANGHDVFTPNEDALMALVVNTFYKEKK